MTQPRRRIAACRSCTCCGRCSPASCATQPVAGSHASVVQALLSSAVDGACARSPWPDCRLSFVHTLLSLQSIARVDAAGGGSQASVVQALLSLQTIGVKTQPVAGSQLSFVHALLSLQSHDGVRAARCRVARVGRARVVVVAARRSVCRQPCDRVAGVVRARVVVVAPLTRCPCCGTRGRVAGVVGAGVVVVAPRAVRVHAAVDRVAARRRAGVVVVAPRGRCPVDAAGRPGCRCRRCRRCCRCTARCGVFTQPVDRIAACRRCSVVVVARACRAVVTQPVDRVAGVGRCRRCCRCRRSCCRVAHAGRPGRRCRSVQALLSLHASRASSDAPVDRVAAVGRAGVVVVAHDRCCRRSRSR